MARQGPLVWGKEKEKIGLEQKGSHGGRSWGGLMGKQHTVSLQRASADGRIYWVTGCGFGKS